MVVNRELLDIRMKEVNLNYSALANIIGFNRSTFYKIINGENKPSYDTMNCIVYILNLTATDIKDIFFANTILPQKILEDYFNSSATLKEVRCKLVKKDN